MYVLDNVTKTTVIFVIYLSKVTAETQVRKQCDLQ